MLAATIGTVTVVVFVIIISKLSGQLSFRIDLQPKSLSYCKKPGRLKGNIIAGPGAVELLLAGLHGHAVATRLGSKLFSTKMSAAGPPLA